MGFQFNIFSIALIGSGIITAILSILILRKRGEVLKWFGLLIVTISVWAHTYGLELASETLSQMLFFIRLEYLAIATLPAFWIIFVIKYVGKGKWINTKTFVAIFTIPILTILVVWTNNYHHLHYTDVNVDNSGNFPLLNFTVGIWYRLNALYFYLLMAFGLYLLIIRYRRSEAIYKGQNLTLIVGALIPWVVNLLYLLDFRPLQHIDLTPFAFSLTALSIAFGILRYKLFELLPVARDKVLEVMQDGVLVLDRKNRVIFVNNTMKKFLNVPVLGLTGTEIDFLFPSEDKLLMAVKTQIQTAVELKIKHGLEIKYFEVLITPIYEKNDSFSGQLLIFRDITNSKLYGDKLRSQTEELKSLNGLKDRLFSIIAHDLQGPMGSLKDLLAMADTGEVSNDEIKMLVPHISKYVNNVSDLMENLLQWSRNQISGIEINKEEVKINHVVTSVLNLFEKKALEKKINIIVNIDQELEVMVDISMLQFIIRNLVANAIKFSNPDDTITIFSETDEYNTTISVSDTGVGIKEQNIGKLFRLEAFTTKGTKAEKGTGLGLLLCKEFIEKNNGKIWVDSEWGKGSTFSFTVPTVLEPVESHKK